MLQPTAASAAPGRRPRGARPAERTRSARYTPSTKPSTAPTTGTTKKPTTPRTPPASSEATSGRPPRAAAARGAGTWRPSRRPAGTVATAQGHPADGVVPAAGPTAGRRPRPARARAGTERRRPPGRSTMISPASAVSGGVRRADVHGSLRLRAAGRRLSARRPARWPGWTARASDSSWMSASAARSASWWARPWWAQNSSSPPPGRTTRM